MGLKPETRSLSVYYAFLVAIDRIVSLVLIFLRKSFTTRKLSLYRTYEIGFLSAKIKIQDKDSSIFLNF